MKSILIKANS